MLTFQLIRLTYGIVNSDFEFGLLPLDNSWSDACPAPHLSDAYWDYRNNN